MLTSVVSHAFPLYQWRINYEQRIKVIVSVLNNCSRFKADASSCRLLTKVSFKKSSAIWIIPRITHFATQQTICFHYARSGPNREMNIHLSVCCYCVGWCINRSFVNGYNAKWQKTRYDLCSCLDVNKSTIQLKSWLSELFMCTPKWLECFYKMTTSVSVAFKTICTM